ncbi:MAG TPA: hypothetical protein VKB76_16155 [Ktedonobacterales bacterium]|nr:hypothetical protein [Ktedonobacterales bacterium]
MAPLTPATLAVQRALSQSIVDLVSAAIRSTYHIASAGIDMGSFARGTNISKANVDIDIFFPCIPNDDGSRYHDWTPHNTYGTHSDPGMTDPRDVNALDPILWRAITATMRQLEPVASALTFQWVRSGQELAGVVYSIAALTADRRCLAVDVTLSYESTHFGVEHARRLQRYLAAVTATAGEDRTMRLLDDIRHLKRLTHDAALVNGEVDKAQKVPGFIIEALFTMQLEPQTFADVIRLVREHTWFSDAPPLPDYIVDQSVQLVDAGMPTQAALAHVTRGGYATLKRVAEQAP